MKLELINHVILQARLLASHSWEYGALSEALLEWYNPSEAVFGPNAFPMGKIPNLIVNETQSLVYAMPHIRINSTTLVDGDGAAGDPASLGVSAILIGQTHPEYLAAAERQVDHLLTAVPRWANGAISHRESNQELWADSIYMVPPTLAYWAVQTDNVTLLDVAIEQCNLYQDVLGVHINSTDGNTAWNAIGLWHHIVSTPGGNSDPGIWSTGNAWAAAGMSRALATAQNSRLQAKQALLSQLKNNIKAILDGAIALDNAEPDEPLLRNYLNDTTWFAELSGTTLLTATAYRMAQLDPKIFGHKYSDWADSKIEAVTRMIGSDGLLTPVVNPLNWNDRTPAAKSPEAQSFAIMMFAAYRSFYEPSLC